MYWHNQIAEIAEFHLNSLASAFASCSILHVRFCYTSAHFRWLLYYTHKNSQELMVQCCHHWSPMRSQNTRPPNCILGPMTSAAARSRCLGRSGAGEWPPLNVRHCICAQLEISLSTSLSPPRSPPPRSPYPYPYVTAANLSDCPICHWSLIDSTPYGLRLDKCVCSAHTSSK